MVQLTDTQHPYAPAVRSGRHGYVSGALSVNREGLPVVGRAEALSAAVERLTERLATIDMSLNDVVRMTYYATDITLREEANEQFVALFGDTPPARSFIGVSALPYGASVEIEALAIDGHRRP